jgi:predicted acyl esterase
MITRYGRSHAGQQPILAVRFFAERGYAVVRVDTRGSGASFGAWTGPLSRDERSDARAIVPYAARSPAPLCSLRI